MNRARIIDRRRDPAVVCLFFVWTGKVSVPFGLRLLSGEVHALEHCLCVVLDRSVISSVQT